MHHFKNYSMGDFACATEDSLARFNYKKSAAVEKSAYFAAEAVKHNKATRDMGCTMPVSVANHVHNRGNAFVSPNSPDVRRISRTPILGIF